jgi:transposase-like protein
VEHEEKLELVAEACQPGNPVSQVSRERGISASQLFGWRRKAIAQGLITDRCLEELPAMRTSLNGTLRAESAALSSASEGLVGQHNVSAGAFLADGPYETVPSRALRLSVRLRRGNY